MNTKELIIKIINPEWEHAQFVSIADLKECEKKLEAANERIKRLEKFARTIENDFDHDEDAHEYGTTCRVCYAEDLLKETKAKEAKP